MKEKYMYCCAICGNGYKTVDERSECEAKCIKERKEAEAQMKLIEEKENRLRSEKAIEEIFEQADEMIKAHFEKYETLNICKNYHYLSYVFKKPFFWM